MNPHKSSSSESVGESVSRNGVRHRWLVLASLLCAVFLEILPVEAGLLLAAAVNGNVFLLFLTKLLCLAAIVAPLLVYFRINGRPGVTAVSRRLAIIGGIVALNLVLDALIVASILRS